MNLCNAEIMAAVEADRKERAAQVAKIWRADLSYKDWLFDGRPIRGDVMIARFNNLDWENSWIDLGPSIVGNSGPYWHVPLKETWINGELYDHGDTVHRLYPKVLQSKWAMLLLHACYESGRMREHVPGQDTVSRLSREIERLRKGIQDYLDGNYISPRDGRKNGAQTKCPHGMFYWDACENCIDEHFAKLLSFNADRCEAP